MLRKRYDLYRDRLLRWLIERFSALVVSCYKAQKVPVWRSADGRVRLISQMDDQHLFNAIGVLQRQHVDGKQQAVYPYLIAEKKKREAIGIVFEPQRKRGWKQRHDGWDNVLYRHWPR